MAQIGIFFSNSRVPPRRRIAPAIVAGCSAAAIVVALALALSARHVSVPMAFVRVPVQKVGALMVFAAIFVPLERLFARRQQPALRAGWRADVLYFWLNSFFANAGTFVAVVVVGYALRALVPGAMHHAIVSQPAGAQFAEAFLLGEIGEYWAHRGMHEVPWLWRFHKVHHAVREMDWLASARLHPVDRALTRSAAFLPLFVLGFSTTTIGAFGLFAALQAVAVHANVRFTFGPLTYVVATPQFHHWHHAGELYDKNYAAQLPVVDWLFGSLHIPGNAWPNSYGIEEPSPEAYLEQLAWPCRKTNPARAMAPVPAPPAE